MRAGVFLCADEPSISYDGVDGFPIKGLCDSPMLIVDQIGDVDRAVLVLHRGCYDLAEVQKALRSADIDPLGAQILDSGPEWHEAAVSRAVAGLRRRALAFMESEPEHAKPVLRGEVTRRGLFRPPQPVYLAAPLVDHGVCAASNGCRACADSCPQQAYKWQQGRIHFNKDVCEPCGRCVVACPTGAISNPAATPAMLEAHIASLIDQDESPVGIRFVCDRSDSLSVSPGWYDVSVPCTGMVRGGWLLTTLLMGAGAVVASPCSAVGCPLGLDEHSGLAVDFARAVLDAVSLDTDLVRTEPAPVRASVMRQRISAPFTHRGDAEAILAFASLAGGVLYLEHAGSPVGVVAIEAETCTLCAQCAQTCPTDALTTHYDGATVSLSFDAARCTNCRQCLAGCPEIRHGAISLASAVDVALLRGGRRTAHEGEVLVCESCGKAFAPSPMMDRIRQLLGDDFSATMPYLASRCVDCRGLA